MKDKIIKQEEAKVRSEFHNKLSIKERIAKLDAKFGVGKGAARERTRLLNRLEGNKNA